jgi:hypothetical protein
MYNGGNDRIYVPLDRRVLEELRTAKERNQTIAETLGHEKGRRGTAAVDTNKTIASRRSEASSAAAELIKGATTTTINTQVKMVDELTTADAVRKYFGNIAGDLQYAVNIAAGSVGEGVEAPETPQEVTS